MLSDSDDFDESDAEEDLSNRSIQVTSSPSREYLLPLLECPVCFDLPLPPIRTCYQGHIICADCCPKLSLCPLCQKPIGIGRNFFAEDFLSKSIMKCKYHEDGCLIELPGFRIKKHMEDCQFRPLKCQKCSTKVSFSDIEDHLLRQHGISKWDLNEQGARIVLCQKLRTHNPYGALRNVLPSTYFLKFILAGLVLSFLADHFYFDSQFDFYSFNF